MRLCGAVVKAHRGGDEAFVCSRCRRRIDGLVYDGSEELVACCSRQGSQRRRRCDCTTARRSLSLVRQLGGACRLLSRLTEEETIQTGSTMAGRLSMACRRLSLVVKARRGGDDAKKVQRRRVGGCRLSSRLTEEETT
jgi:hypothetical protein